MNDLPEAPQEKSNAQGRAKYIADKLRTEIKRFEEDTATLREWGIE